MKKLILVLIVICSFSIPVNSFASNHFDLDNILVEGYTQQELKEEILSCVAKDLHSMKTDSAVTVLIAICKEKARG